MGRGPFRDQAFPLRAVEKASGYLDLILRPLSARLLPETRPEREEARRRTRLLDISGRSRNSANGFNENYGLKNYPSGPGLCFLTDPIFSRRIKELLAHSRNRDLREIELLKTGRFRHPNLKIIIGRNKKENEAIEALAEEQDLTARCLVPVRLAWPWASRPRRIGKGRFGHHLQRYPEGRMGSVQLIQKGRTWTQNVLKLPKETFKQWAPLNPSVGATGGTPTRGFHRQKPMAIVMQRRYQVDTGSSRVWALQGFSLPFSPGNRSFFPEGPAAARPPC